jgi:hypothetical protein
MRAIAPASTAYLSPTSMPAFRSASSAFSRSCATPENELKSYARPENLVRVADRMGG